MSGIGRISKNRKRRMLLNWDMDSSGVYTAASAIHDDGTRFIWRIKKRMGAWRVVEPFELVLPRIRTAKYSTVDAAKRAVEACEAEWRKEMDKPRRKR